MSNSHFPVGPAKAGTHNRRPSSLRESRRTDSFQHMRHAWVPAFTGTTTLRKHIRSHPRNTNVPEPLIKAPATEWRRECRTTNAPAASHAKVKSMRVTTGQPNDPAFRARLVLTVSFVLPGEPGLLLPSPATMRSIVARLTSASRRQDHDFTVRRVAVRLAAHERPSHPAPANRDDREAPLSLGAG
jgi:hypothetical protein